MLFNTRKRMAFGYTTDMRRLLLLLTVILCASLPLIAAQWVAHGAPGVTIYVKPGEEKLAQRMQGVARHELSRLMDDLGIPTAGPFPVYVYSSRLDFQRDTGNNPMLRGVSYLPTGVIRVDASSGAEIPERQVLAHELTHSLLAQYLDIHMATLPIWVNEGMAGHLSSPIARAELERVSRVVYREGVLSLDELENTFRKGIVRDGAYLQSQSMVAWLEYRHPGALRDLIQAMAGGRDFEGALHEVTGLTPQQWLSGWRGDVPTIIIWLTYFLSTPITYAPFAVLVIFAVIARIRKRQQELRAREEEEEGEDDEDADWRTPGRVFRGYGDQSSADVGDATPADEDGGDLRA